MASDAERERRFIENLQREIRQREEAVEDAYDRYVDDTLDEFAATDAETMFAQDVFDYGLPEGAVAEPGSAAEAALEARTIMMEEMSQTSLLYELKAALNKAELNIERSVTLQEAGAMTAETAGEAIATSREMADASERAIGTVEEKMKSWNDAIHEFVDAYHKGARDWVSEMYRTSRDRINNSIKDFKKDLKKQEKIKTRADKKLKDAEEAFAEDDNPVTRDALARARADAAKATEDVANTTREISVASEESVNAAKHLAETVRSSAMGLANKGIEAAGIDAAKTWEAVGRLSDSFHVSVAHISEGYTRYLKKVTGADEIEFDSELWKEAREMTRGMSEREAVRVESEIARLSKLATKADKSEFIAQAAKYMSPTSRMFLSIGSDFEYFRHATWARTFVNAIDPRFYFTVIKESARAGVTVAMAGVEAVVGPEILEGLTRGLVELGVGTGRVLGWMLGPQGMMMIGGIIMLIDYNKHGFGWRLLDDFLGLFFMSLKTFGPSAKMKEYPKFSKKVGSADNTMIRMFYYDWKELSMAVDFWGKHYVDVSNVLDKGKGKKKPAYQPMKKFDAIMRVPGLYIDPKNHPLDTDAELKECMSIEAQIDANIFVGKDFVSPSLVSQYYPRIPGLVRNLVNFPMYKKTYQWVDPGGAPIQLSGNFSERELDPSLVELFKMWVDRGTWGPAYNQAKTRKAQLAAIAANKADYKQWIEMSPNGPMAAHELDEWLGTARGHRGVSAYDMIMLAPKDFDMEWNADLPKEELAWFGVEFKWPQMKHQYVNRYEEQRQAVGRYTYHPEDRVFMETLMRTGKIMQGSFVFPGMPAPADCVETKWIVVAGQDALVCLRLVEASKEQRDTYTTAYKKGQEYRAALNRRKTETKAEWDADVLKAVFKSYRISEKPFRTKWGYILKYKSFFIEELQFLTMSMISHGRVQVWKDFLKLLSGQHIPLNMSSHSRMSMMAIFAEAAYLPDQKSAKAFEKAIGHKFGGFLENAVVTTGGTTKKDLGPWAFDVNTVVHAAVHLAIPAFFGHLQCRVFVLKNPVVVILAFRGTSNLTEAIIDLDFCSADFVEIDDSHPGDPQFRRENTGATVPWQQLLEDENRFTAHRGFLRAFQALRPGLANLLQGYYKKYPEMQSMFITGHSLGAAVAQLAAIGLPRVPRREHKATLFQGPNQISGYLKPNCYAFASPLVGDHRFGRFFDEYTNESVQVWNDGDIVTMVPPFLLPAADVTAQGYKSTLDVIESLAEEDHGLAGLLYALSIGFEQTGIDAFDSLKHLAHDIKQFDPATMSALAMKLSVAANRNRPIRGGQVFMRLSLVGSASSFDETAYDSGNSEFIFKLLAQAGHGKKDLVALHSMITIRNALIGLSAKEPDLFTKNAADLPSWARGGSIRPKPRPGKRIPDKIMKQLIDGSAQIIGYAHTKHHHRPWSIVPMSDVDKEQFVFGAQVDMQPVEDKHQNSIKRRRMDRHDASYRSSTYL